MAKINANIDSKMAKINFFEIQLLINVGFPVLPGKPRINDVNLPRAFVDGVEGELAAVGVPARVEVAAAVDVAVSLTAYRISNRAQSDQETCMSFHATVSVAGMTIRFFCQCAAACAPLPASAQFGTIHSLCKTA